MKLKSLMVKEVVTCAPHTNLEEAGRLMWHHDCGAIPVLDDDGHPIGIITDRDIAMSAVLNHKPLWDISAGEVTGGRELFTCQANDDIQTGLAVMQSRHIRRMPVVNGDGRLLGMLSIDDIVARSGQPKGKRPPPVTFEETITTLKAVGHHH